MSKKYYAVRCGRSTGIFDTWTECQKQVMGFANAEFKSFVSLDDANQYMLGAMDTTQNNNDSISNNIASLAEDSVIAFVDGSFNNELKAYSFGAVIISSNGEKELSDSFVDEVNIESRNVAGELMGARSAISYAISQKKRNITLYYDYMGIECWANKSWKANLPLTKGYVEFIDEAKKYINIKFAHVKAHSGIIYNERVDALAKSALEKLKSE